MLAALESMSGKHNKIEWMKTINYLATAFQTPPVSWPGATIQPSQPDLFFIYLP